MGLYQPCGPTVFASSFARIGAVTCLSRPPSAPCAVARSPDAADRSPSELRPVGRADHEPRPPVPPTALAGHSQNLPWLLIVTECQRFVQAFFLAAADCSALPLINYL